MQTPKHKSKIKFLFLIIILILAWYTGRFFHPDTEAIKRSLSSFPIVYSGILFIILYVIVTFFIWLSKDVFWITGAVLFGAFFSALFIYIAEIINAWVLFYLSRFLGRAFLDKSLTGKYKDLDERLGRINFFWLFTFRAAPLLPYRFLDLSAGLTKIHFRKYFTAVVLGSPPKVFWIQYILFGVGQTIFNNPNALVEYFLQHKGLLLFSFIYLILVMVVVLKIKPQHYPRR